MRSQVLIQGFATDSEFTSQLGTVAKLAMRQPFVLFKGLTFQKLC
ncbi:DNA integrase IntI1, partial [Raoultella ornithinolytica]